MNATIFHKWFIDMLGNLEEPCIIVMDNATYHSTLTEEYPKANTRKTDVQKWLQDIVCRLFSSRDKPFIGQKVLVV